MIQILVGSGIFISAFLLFFIQLLLAKHMLPQFGGGAFVWITSMLFFQAALLLGYLYAYLLAKLPSLRIQAFIHFGLILASLYYIPIHLDALVVESQVWPPLSVCHLLISIIILPFVIISASSPLLQHWYSYVEKSEFPYYFYSISNAGSLIGLLGYPFFIEPSLGLKHQATLWSMMYIGYCVLCALFMATFVFKKQVLLISEKVRDVTALKAAEWIFLSFISSALLLSITQFLAQNIINLPLMWVVPLALYLISFIVTFANDRVYDRSFWLCSFFVFLSLVLWLSFMQSLVGYDILIVLLGLLYCACMICHGELIQRKPSKNGLTTFYLFIALGGVLGSLFVNLVAFVLLGKSWDFYIPLILISLFVAKIAYTYTKEKQPSWEFKVITRTAAVIVIVLTTLNVFSPQLSIVAEKRTVYGLIRVFDHGKAEQPNRYREMRNGQILHGLQFLSPEKKRIPTSYYGESSGINLAIRYLIEHSDHPLNIAAIGLGSGTVATYGRKGDRIDFYELDPTVIDFAKKYFSFLESSPAKINIILGDARLSLVKARFTPDFSHYDLIIADAFSGDAVPFHLLTNEAMSLYQSLLTKNGFIAIHASNTFINFMPLTKNEAKAFGLQHFWIKAAANGQTARFANTWAIMTRDPHFKAWLEKQSGFTIQDSRQDTNINWTDDDNSVLPLLRIWRL